MACKLISIYISLGVAYGGDLTEVCNSNHFEGRCLDDEVIIIETAQYGRLQIGSDDGRCMTETLGYINCVNDVTTIAETHCSGKRKCSVRVDDSMFLGSNPPCNPEVKNHLWISYSCQKGGNDDGAGDSYEELIQ
ncbi:hypothetical protein HELRODRAFT_180473 [Helobdella robusta]|uniref:SUEL-type lectin domain-containing protein n=1 Tax=Helobdella robusta TaxID=6412 RepID=T1FFZ1_HELRO|nr:hypothetical protein HELRODRAFT_180473 [Helobdella robusta]ESN93823.1 hypothetical protein HELRODRAFT_180473 [Helobdella robusta]